MHSCLQERQVVQPFLDLEVGREPPNPYKYESAIAVIIL